MFYTQSVAQMFNTTLVLAHPLLSQKGLGNIVVSSLWAQCFPQYTSALSYALSHAVKALKKQIS